MISKFFDHGHTIPWRPYLSEALQQHAERIGEVVQSKDYTNYAIILQQVHYWTDPYREYKSSEYRPEYARRPGDIARYWIYRTWVDWHRDLFSLSDRAMRNGFYRLRDWGFLLSVQFDDPNWQGQFWAVNHERLDELFAETKLPAPYKDGKRMSTTLLSTIFEEVDRSWDQRPVSNRFSQIEPENDDDEAEKEPWQLLPGGGGSHYQGGVAVTARGGWQSLPGGTSILEDHFINHEKDHDHEGANAPVSDVNDMSDVTISSSKIELSEEEKATNKAMLTDEYFGLNWSRTTAELAGYYKPEQLCIMLIRASENHRAGRIQNLPGWIIKVLRSPDPDIMQAWEDDTNHWIYKKHILKQEPNTTPVREEPPLVPPPPPLANGNGYSSPEKPVLSQAQQLWMQALIELALQMPAATYDTWVKDTTGLSYEDGQFVVGVPNAYARDWLGNRLRTNIKRVLSRQVGRAVEVIFQVRDPV